MNPCSKCGIEPLLDIDYDNFATLVCQGCGNVWKYNAWNDNNPIPEPDPLAIVRAQLAECYTLLNFIAESPYSAIDDIDFQAMARDLVAKHRSENA